MSFRVGSLGDADDPAGDAAAGVAGGLGFEVVGLLVDDEAAADDRGRAFEAELSIDRVVGGMALVVG